MRKFGCLAMVVLLLAIVLVPAAVPADAVGHVEGIEAPETRYGVLQFDRINFFDGSRFYSASYPFNNAVVGSYQSTFESFDGFLSGSCSLYSDSSKIYGSLLVPTDGTVLNIYGGQQIVRAESLQNKYDGYTGFSFYLEPFDSFIVRTVQLRVTVCSLTAEHIGSGGFNDRLTTEYNTLTSEVFMTGSGEHKYYEVGDKLYEMLTSNGFTDLVYIESITLSIDFSEIPGNVDTPVFQFSIGTSANAPGNYFSTWVYQQNVPIEVIGQGASVPVNMFDWLIDAVEGFLDFEIVPNLSINNILNIILVIGIMLWLIRLIS